MLNQHVAQVELLEIGNIPQGIAVTGNPENPVLLILHGGGLPLPGVASKSSYRLLEEHFLLVFWDQRGTGKSTHPRLNAGNMSIENFLNDVAEITDYVKARFDKEKIYLLGHSWGSMIGLASVVHNPNEYHGYIGVSQQINLKQSDTLVFSALEQKSRQDSLEGQLKNLGPPPYDLVSDWLALRELVARHGGLVSGKGDIGMIGLLRHMFGSYLFNRDYPWFELFRVQRNMNFVMEHTYADMLAFDMSDVSALQIPILLLHGSHDLNSHPQVAKHWLEQLDAPSKRWVDLERSAHMPMWEQGECFQRQVIEILK